MKMKPILIASTIAATLLLVTGCTTNETKQTTGSTETESKTTESVDLNSLDLPQLSDEVTEDEDLVELVTTAGTIKMKLFPKYAPKAVENFMTHAKEGYYDNVPFHRVIKDFMIQTGDPTGTGSGGESIWDEEFAPEISPNLYHLNGAVAMARTNGEVTEKTQGSQFYIVQNERKVSDGLLSKYYPDRIIEAYKNGGVPSLDFKYSVFGQVIEGMDVVKEIANTKTDSTTDAPIDEIKIEKITILQEAK